MSRQLITRLKKDFPCIAFSPADSFYWSPKKQIVYYSPVRDDDEVSIWSLLHELAHGLLEHQTYESDFELVQLEVEAWEQAKKLAQKYDYLIDTDHIQDCLDTYRDWLYLRSTCPSCTNCSLQIETHTYSCFNCNETWRVSNSRKCRTYRRKQPELLVQTI